jgi:hypothetical protein
MARWRQAFGAVFVTICCVSVVVGPAAATNGSLSPAVSLSTLAPHVMLPGRQTEIRLTGMGFVAGTTFSFGITISSFGPVPTVENTALGADGTSATLLVTSPPDSRGLYLFNVTAPGQQTTPIDTVVVRSAAGTFNPINPFRALDTRSGIGEGRSRSARASR